jgi:hypothetical protein
MTSTGLGYTIFNRSSFASSDNARPALTPADFETKIQIPDTASPVSGIFILPVARQIGAGADGAAAEHTLYSAVAVNRPTMLRLLEDGHGDMLRPTLMQAKAEADAINVKSYRDAQSQTNISTWHRSSIDLRAMCVAMPVHTIRPS